MKKEKETKIDDDGLDILEKSFEELWQSQDLKDQNGFIVKLRGIIRDELQALLFDIKCDAQDELTGTPDTNPTPVPPLDERAETMEQAAYRRSKEAKKRRTKWKKEIEKKKDQRHKCRKNRMNEELQRWKVLADI